MPGSIAEPFGALAALRAEGLIKHLGVSMVDAAQVAEAQSIAPITTVQNWYNVAHRGDEELIATLRRRAGRAGDDRLPGSKRMPITAKVNFTGLPAGPSTSPSCPPTRWST